METELWIELRDGMHKQWHASRVESHETSPGFPDVNYCIAENGQEGDLELKFGYITKMPKMRNTQVRWHMFRYKAGGRSFILSKIVNGAEHTYVYMLHRGKEALELSMNRNYKYWHATAMIKWVDNIDFNKLELILGGSA